MTVVACKLRGVDAVPLSMTAATSPFRSRTDDPEISRPALPAHVTLGTCCRRPVFADEAVALNVYLLVREHALTLAAVLMPSHLHWLLRDGAELPRVVERFKSHSTRRAQAAGHEGRLWQPGFFDAVVERESMVRPVASYLLTNPVAAELAPSWREYPWAYLHPSLDG